MNIAENAKGVSAYKASTELWAQMPSFEYQWEPADRILADHVLEWGIILGWTILSFGAMLLFSKNLKAAFL